MTITDRRPARIGEEQLALIASRLTDRDRRIALDCYEHRLLTTEQLRRLHFAGARKARQRLGELHEMRVLERARPPWQRGEGSTPYHWTLDLAGAHIVAANLGIDRTDLHWHRTPAATLVSSTTRQHLTAINEFATRLHEEARHAGGALHEWLGERGAHQLLDGIVTPDSYLRLEHPDVRTVHLLLELDRGTEDHDRLLTKTHRYAKAIPRSRLADLDPLVLLLVPGARRAATLTRTLAESPVPIVVRPWTPADGATLDLVTDAAIG